MHWRQKAKLALEILQERGNKNPFAQLSESQLEDKAKDIIDYVLNLLFAEAAVVIDQLMVLGFNNQQIAYKTGCDESTLSRVHSKNHELQIALPTLKDLVSELRKFLPNAKVERAHQTLAPAPLVATDFCKNNGQAVREGDVDAATQAVLKNLVYGLTGNVDQRVPLPPPFHGVLLRLGPWQYGLSVYQSDGQSDSQRLAHEIHELEHVLIRMKDHLSTLEKADRERAPKRSPKPRSEF